MARGRVECVQPLLWSLGRDFMIFRSLKHFSSASIMSNLVDSPCIQMIFQGTRRFQLYRNMRCVVFRPTALKWELNREEFPKQSNQATSSAQVVVDRRKAATIPRSELPRACRDSKQRSRLCRCAGPGALATKCILLFLNICVLVSYVHFGVLMGQFLAGSGMR